MFQRTKKTVDILMEGLDEFMEWKNQIITIEALPTNVLSRLGVIASKLCRCKGNLRFDLTTVLDTASQLSAGLIRERELNEFKEELAKKATALQLAATKEFQLKRNLKSSLAQIIRLKSNHRLMKWQRLSSRVRETEDAMQHEISSEEFRATIDRLEIGLKQQTAKTASAKAKKHLNNMRTLMVSTRRLTVRPKEEVDIEESTGRSSVNTEHGSARTATPPSFSRNRAGNYVRPSLKDSNRKDSGSRKDSDDSNPSTRTETTTAPVTTNPIVPQRKEAPPKSFSRIQSSGNQETNNRITLKIPNPTEPSQASSPDTSSKVVHKPSKTLPKTTTEEPREPSKVVEKKMVIGMVQRPTKPKPTSPNKPQTTSPTRTTPTKTVKAAKESTQFSTKVDDRHQGAPAKSPEDQNSMMCVGSSPDRLLMRLQAHERKSEVRTSFILP